MTIYDLIALSPLVLLAYGAWRHGHIGLIAKAAVRRHCTHEDVQLLDHTVVLKKISLARSNRSLLALRRTYQFEFSTIGDIRYPGAIRLIGDRVEHIELSPFKPRTPPEASQE